MNQTAVGPLKIEAVYAKPYGPGVPGLARCPVRRTPRTLGDRTGVIEVGPSSSTTVIGIVLASAIGSRPPGTPLVRAESRLRRPGLTTVRGMLDREFLSAAMRSLPDAPLATVLSQDGSV